jgi:DNA-binding transcriptional LysR family regulator
MLEDFRLAVFMAVAQEGSFTKAAARLGISQPAVSQHISELERTTGVKLFERLRGEVVLTEPGRIFQIHAKRILEAYTSASSLFSSVDPCSIRVKVSDEVYNYIYAALEQFMNIHPEVHILRTDNEADLRFALAPAPQIALMHKNMGGISATHNIISSLYLSCQPSETFAQSELFESLRSFLADYFTI